MDPRITKAARRLLDTANLEVRRKEGSAPRRSLAQVATHLHAMGVRPATVIDVGIGWEGTPELYAAFPEAKLLLVDPLAEWEPVMRAIAARRPAEVVVAAAGPQAGERELTVHRSPSCSSMVGERAGDGTEAVRRVVPVVTLDDVVAERGLGGPYVVKVDVEGGELEVLDGAQQLLHQADAVILEVSLFELVPDAPTFGDVVTAMWEDDWALYDVHGGHLRPLDGALAQLDLTFVRKESRLRSDHRYATPEQADALYRSWGH